MTGAFGSLLTIGIMAVIGLAGVIVMSILCAKKSRYFAIGIAFFGLLLSLCIVYGLLAVLLISGID